MAGLANCPCGVGSVFGVDADLQDGSERFQAVAITIVPAVLGKFAGDNNNVLAGEDPPDSDPNWHVGLQPLWDRYETGADMVRMSDVNGARVVHDAENGRYYVVVFLSGARDGADDYEGGAEPNVIYVIDYETKETVVMWSASDAEAINAFPIRNAYTGAMIFNVWQVGISRNTITEVAYGGTNRRLNLTTGEIGIGDHSLVNSGEVPCYAPAQMSEGGLPWVVAYDPNEIEKGMWTGKWVNALVSTDFMSIGKSVLVLSTGEAENRIDNKTGYPGDEVTAVEIMAYTRRNGYDYVLIRNGLNYYYYDGRLAQWLGCTDSSNNNISAGNIYATAEGDVIYSGGVSVHYRAVDGDDWDWEPTGGEGVARVAISASDDWVQVKGMQTDADPTGNSAAAVEFFTTETPDWFYGNDDFSPDDDVRNWSLSRKKVGGSVVAVPHRTHCWINNDPGDPIWHLGVARDFWMNQAYWTKRGWEHNCRTGLGHLQLYRSRGTPQDDGLLFDAAPWCACCGGPAVSGY